MNMPLTPKKLYKNQIIVLQEGKKNLTGAKQYIQDNYGRLDEYCDIVIGVGNNDVDSFSVEALLKLGSLLNTIKTLLPDTNVHILQALPRFQDSNYNRKIVRYNAGLYTLETENIMIITNNEIRERDQTNLLMTIFIFHKLEKML